MNIHKNARLTPLGRERIVRLVLNEQTPEAAARAVGVCPQTVRKRVARFAAEGIDGLQDRSSRPHRLSRPTPHAIVAQIEALRRRRWTGKQIAAETGVSPATVSRTLKRLGLNRIEAPEPVEAVRSYECEQPSELIHLEMKKLGRFDRIGHRLRKLGEDVTRTLETQPRQWKVIETVREKFTCRDCEKISQAPAPFHVIARGWAGASLLAMIMFEKFGQHQPLNRQTERYALEGVPIALSTMADAVGSVCKALDPLLRLVEGHVMAAERLHGDDTTVPVLAKGKTDTGRCWVYVRDDQPFGGAGPPAAMFYYSRDRRGEHPQAHLAAYAGILQADAYDGYNRLYRADRKPGPIREAACWVHARRPFFAMADLEENARRKSAGKKEIPLSPIAIEVVRRIDALFEIERSINGKTIAERLATRRTLIAPLVEDLRAYMSAQLPKLPRGHDLAKAINYMLKRWAAFTLFLEDGRVCLSNNAAERGLRGIALGRKSWLFCGSDRGGQRVAAMYSLIVIAKMNDVDPQARLADILARIASHPAHRLDDLLPWNWLAKRPAPEAKAA